jgi:hypothetical protein
MLDPNWLIPWWRHFGNQHRLAAGLILDPAGKPVGLAPFFARIHRYKGGLCLRRLEFLGSSASSADAVCSEYLDVIARRNSETPVAECIASYLMHEPTCEWDELVMEAMAEDGLGHEVAAALERKGCLVTSEVYDHAHFIELPGSWDRYLGQFTKKRRQALRYVMRDFVRWVGPAGFQRHRAIDFETLSTGMNALISLHTQRWAQAGHGGAFASRRFREFHLEYTQNALASGQLDLTWITVDGDPVAAQYNIIDGDQVSFYQCGRRIDLPKRVRLGTVMLILSLQDAITRGSRVYDFLGGEAQYKSIFANGSRPLTRVRIGRPQTRELVFQSLKGVQSIWRLATGRRTKRP